MFHSRYLTVVELTCSAVSALLSATINVDFGIVLLLSTTLTVTYLMTLFVFFHQLENQTGHCLLVIKVLNYIIFHVVLILN